MSCGGGWSVAGKVRDWIEPNSDKCSALVVGTEISLEGYCLLIQGRCVFQVLEN